MMKGTISPLQISELSVKQAQIFKHALPEELECIDTQTLAIVIAMTVDNTVSGEIFKHLKDE